MAPSSPILRKATIRDLDAVFDLATRRAAMFYEAIGYENSATFFRKSLQ
jgi:hypothetical protein